MCPSAQTVKLQWRQVRLRDWSNGVKIRMLMFSVAEILAGINRKVAGWFLAGLALLRKS